MGYQAALIVLSSVCLVGVFHSVLADSSDNQKPDLLVVTVATDENDGFNQFMRSIKKYGLDIQVFGMGEEWRGGTMETVGGGHKINLLKKGLQKYKDRDDLLLMFSDSYDVVFTDGKEAILDKFAKFDARVVFGAEDLIWPDKTLEIKYPPVKDNEKRFLNSGGFIGYAKEVLKIVNYLPIEDDADDQLYYTNIFLDRRLRHEWGIKLDTKCDIFQNLHSAFGQITMKYKGSHSYLYNIKTGVSPIVIHGNGPIKPEFYRLSNYLADGWTATSGCLSCDENLLDIESLERSEYPTVMIASFVEYATPFIREFFKRIALLDYPKNKIDIYIHNKVPLHEKEIKEFVDAHRSLYRSVRVVEPSEGIEEGTARNWAIDECINKNCGYLFAVDSIAQITEEKLLKDLIHQNRSILAPMFKRHEKFWSNFWGALNSQGFYARSEDYMEIVAYDRIGLWNVPHISTIMLLHGHVLPKLKDAYTHNPNMDPDMSFSQMARDKGVFMYVSNRDQWGHLVFADYFDTSHLNNELFDIFNNPLDWATRYIHENYSLALQEDAVMEMPCPDVYWFPIVSETFCREFIDECENFGRWSNGKNEDPRLAGGYENVPTVDIHMNQIGLEQQWLKFLQDFVRPLQEKVFTGYYHNPPQAFMNFIVRYRPDEQPFLRPHHDASTYTINIALNKPGVDFEGGGCRFVRYNCSITSPKTGWMFMHPGRLTHYHEGLRTTKGTRYIMISFIDP